MVLLGDEAEVEAHFSPFGDSSNLDAREVHGLRRMYQPLVSHFGLLGDVGHVKSSFRPFGDCISVGARQVHGLYLTYHRLKNHFGRTQ
jgi:hypothetical protein